MRKQLSLYLDDSLLKMVKKEAFCSGINTSCFIRNALYRYLNLDELTAEEIENKSRKHYPAIKTKN